MITFTMRREGQFVTNFSTSNNQCGKAGLDWSHIDDSYTCLTSPYKFAAVNGNEHILQSDFTPSRDNHEHKFEATYRGYDRCTVCHMSDVYLYGKHGAREKVAA